jgi:PAS domain S-box-containing protein
MKQAGDITARKQTDESLRRSLEQTARGQRLLTALSQVAQAVQRAHTPEEIYRTVGDEVARLGYHAAVFILTEDETHLAIPYLNFDPALQRTAERLVGITAADFRLPLTPGGFYQRTLAGEETVFLDPFLEPVTEAMPWLLRPLVGQLTALLGIKQGIIAPLRIRGEVRSLLMVTGDGLTADDVLAVKIFASQTAIALENARLHQETRAWAAELERRVAAQTETIRASEAELRALFAAMRDVILVLDGDGRYLEIAPTSPALLYKPSDELIGKTVRDIFSPAQADFFITQIARALESDQPVNVEYSLPIGDAEIWFDGVLAPLNQNAVIWIARDVTERKRAEEALNESEQRFRSLFAASPDALVLIDPFDPTTDWPVVDCNEIACQMNGYTREELIGSSIDILNIAPGTPQKRAAYLESLRRESVSHLETFHRHQDGHVFPVEVSTSIVTFGGRELILGIDRDITERKQAEEMIRNEKLFSESLLNSLPGIFYLFDTQGKFLRWNKNFERVSEYTSEEMATLNPLDLFIGADKQIIGERIQEAFARGESDAEGRLVAKSGRQTPFYFSGLRADLGGHPCLIGIGLDISAQKQAEEKLKALAADLERSNRELEHFAHVASHDLQEPLRMVSSFMGLLAQRYQGQLDADADEFIGFAIDGAQRMQRLINGLLDYSRVGTHSQPPEPTDAAAVADDALWNLELAIQDAGATVTRDPLPTVMADRDQLMQVFQNLIGNGIKFRGTEPPRVHISAELRDSDFGFRNEGQSPQSAVRNPQWLFSVRDNGIGIAAEHLDRIFGIFQRLHARTEYPGTGIGLATCKKIVERYGGRIWVESQPGQGSTFFFTIPAAP